MHWAISPAANAVRSTRIDRSHPIRSAITVAGIVGRARSNSRIRSSTASTTDPLAARSYLDGSLAIAARTVFRETPITRAIALAGRRMRLDTFQPWGVQNPDATKGLNSCAGEIRASTWRERGGTLDRAG